MAPDPMTERFVIEDHFRVMLAKILVGKDKPTDLPEHYAQAFEKVNQRFTTQFPSKTDWPVIALVADLVKAQQDRIDLLADRLQACEAKLAELDEVAVEVEPEAKRTPGRKKLEPVGA